MKWQSVREVGPDLLNKEILFKDITGDFYQGTCTVLERRIVFITHFTAFKGIWEIPDVTHFIRISELRRSVREEEFLKEPTQKQDKKTSDAIMKHIHTWETGLGLGKDAKISTEMWLKCVVEPLKDALEPFWKEGVYKLEFNLYKRERGEE